MQWVSLEKQKPANGELVIIKSDFGVGVGVYDSAWRSFSSFRLKGSTQYSEIKVTHWMRIPDYPAA
ncbi:hypothetical protein G9I05_004383 [Salmonella enterica]|nr:hypothetical protein [Salmonella enterica]EEN5590587.1 hypothetical protein [Salmonella enterica subsp. enterica serovar Mountpleasant]EIO8738853.1 hypothetical protein [Salmonella enterica]